MCQAKRFDFWPETNRHRAFLIGTIIVAAVFRGVGLLSVFPIWIDEAIYLRWAEIIQHQRSWFVSLLDAKPPLSFWVYAMLRILWSADPLLLARSVSLIAGLLSTWLLFAVGNRLAGPKAGLFGALLYAVVPYAVLYDRLAYTETLVNLSGIVVVYMSLAYFCGSAGNAWGAVGTGVAMGVAYLCKSTAILFLPVPLLVALQPPRRSLRRLIGELTLLYGVAAVFPVMCWLSVPDAPTFATNHLILHRTTFFTPIHTLTSEPLINVSVNLQRLAGYVSYYISVPAALAVLIAAFVCGRHCRMTAVVVLAVGILPVGFTVVVLEWFPSRYLFPHCWSYLLLIAVFWAIWRERPNSKCTGVLNTAAAGLAFVLASHSTAMLTAPRQFLHPLDAEEHLGSGPFSGVGVQGAIEFLTALGQKRPFTLLTDPIWGLPADAMYPYLNHRSGIRVFDAWWMQLSPNYRILPEGTRQIMKSGYERVPAGVVNFDGLESVYYVTATNYNQPQDVWRRQVTAELVVRFPRPNGTDYIDIYRLR